MNYDMDTTQPHQQQQLYSPWDTVACCWDIKQLQQQQQLYGPWDTIACCWDIKQATPPTTLRSLRYSSMLLGH